jgi:hypothetical protein
MKSKFIFVYLLFGLIFLIGIPNVIGACVTPTANYTNSTSNIVLEICTKEFQIEKSQIPEVRNDSEDDTQKS